MEAGLLPGWNNWWAHYYAVAEGEPAAYVGWASPPDTRVIFNRYNHFGMTQNINRWSALNRLLKVHQNPMKTYTSDAMT